MSKFSNSSHSDCMSNMMAGADRSNAHNIARYLIKQYNNGQGNDVYGKTSRKHAGYQNSKTSKNTRNNNLPSVRRDEREKSYFKDEGRSQKEQTEFSLCYDKTQYNMARPPAPDHVILSNHGDTQVTREPIEHKCISKLDSYECRPLHALCPIYPQPCVSECDEAEEEEGKHESENEESTEVELELMHVQVKQN